MIFPGLPKIPKTLVAVLSVDTEWGVLYAVEITVGEEEARRSFRITKVGSDELEFFTQAEIKEFLASKLPAIIKMSGAEIVFRDVHDQVTPL